MPKNTVLYVCALSASAATYFLSYFHSADRIDSEVGFFEKSKQVIKSTKEEPQDGGLLRNFLGELNRNGARIYSSNPKSIAENELNTKAEIADALFDTSVFNIVEPLVRESSKFQRRGNGEQKEEVAAYIVESRWKKHFKSAGLSLAEQQRVSDLLIRLNTHNLELSHASTQGLSTDRIGKRYRLLDIEQELRNILPGEKVDTLIGQYTEAIADRPISIEHAKVYEDRARYPAYAAVTSGDMVELNAYLAAGTDVNELRDYDTSQSLLHYAISFESEELVDVIVNYKPLLDVRDSRGDFPLNLAAKQGNIEIVRLLIEAGADPTSRDALGLTPAMGARLRGLRAKDSSVHKQVADYIDKSGTRLGEIN